MPLRSETLLRTYKQYIRKKNLANFVVKNFIRKKTNRTPLRSETPLRTYKKSITRKNLCELCGKNFLKTETVLNTKIGKPMT